MVTSYNGWKASKDPADFGGLDNSVIPGTDGVRYAPGIRAGAVATIAFWWGWQWHTRVERLVTPGCWGYFYKQSANSANLLSCHAGATAWDTNAPQHPNGKRGTLSGPALEAGKTKAQVVDSMMAYLEGVVYSGKGAWGNGTVDEMHAEIAEGATVEHVEAVAAKILRDFGPRETWTAGAAPAPSPVPAPAPANSGYSEQAKTDQRNLLDTGFNPGPVDGYWGARSTQAAKDFQRAAGLSADGIIGPATRAKLKLVPSWRGAPDAAGDGGYSALRWQQELKKHGWRIATDGAWGPASARILKQFQAEKGLEADGVRGPSSWTALFCQPN